MGSLATLSIPRLRLSRNAHAYERPLSSSPRDHFPEPPDTLADALTEDSDDNDRDDDQESTPKMTPSAAFLDTTETPAARLRALLAQSPASSKSTPMPLPRSRSSDIESDFEPFNASYENTPNATRESLKDIFSRAMRDPGNTPQKEKNKPRRNSIDISEVDASPRVKRHRIENQSKRKSLSDEEADPAKTSETSFRSSQAATFDILRERLINSHSQLKDLHLPDSIYHDSTPDDDNGATTFLRDTNISTTTPPVATSTPQQSLHMSVDSHFPSQFNLLDRDSEMQRAFEGFDSSDTDGASQRPVPFPPSVVSADPTQKPPLSQLTRISESLLSQRESHSSRTLPSGAKGQNATPRLGISRSIPGGDMSRQTPHLQSPQSRSSSVGPSSSRNLLGQRSFDEDSSKGSSLGSQADYQERIAELERERNLERERDWNKPRLSRPTSSLGFHLQPTAQHSRTRSLIHADSIPLVPTRTFQRRDSLTESSRASSPAGSLVSNHDDDDVEIVHERERNWNAPRPKWTHGSPRPVSPFKPQSPSASMRGESLKTPITRKGESPQHSHITNKGWIGDDSTASAQAASSSQPSSSPHSPPHSHTHSQKLQPNGTPLPRSLSPSIAKGKGKALDHSLPLENLVDTVLHDLSHRDRTSFLATKSAPSPGFSFVKKRTPLEPIELESDNLGQKRVSQREDLLSSPTRSSKGSAKPGGIHIRSSPKLKLPSKAHIRSSSPIPNTKTSFVPDARDTNSKSLFPDVVPTVNRDQEDESFEVGDLSQEQLSTTRTMPFPPLETLEQTPPRSSSPLHLSNVGLEQNGTSSQQRSNSNHTPTQKPQRLHGSSSLPSPSSQSPSRDSHVKPMSPLLTPPRRYSTSQIEFQTPSPPKNMPDLPGPPTSSEDETERESTRAPFGPLRSDLTAMKTPRPPGAWTSTPAFQHKIPRPSLPEDSVEHEESDNRSQMPDHDFKTNTTATKTPRPPGSWASAPAPLSSRKLPPDDSLHPVNTEEEHENGLLTPGASSSKGSLSYAQTPAPPGAYMVTPAGRKSIIKVRFDGVDSSGSTHSMTSDPLEDITNTPSSNATPRTNLPQGKIPPRARTLDLSTSNSPVSRRTKSQASPGIRVLDAFGRELVKDGAGKAANNAKKNGIRVVDALGREVEDNDQSSHLTTKETIPELDTPLKRGEALLQVRQGLTDLVNSLNEMDKLEQTGQELDYTRLEKLQQTSAEARVARARVGAAISSNAEDIKNKLKPLRASMKESKLFMSSTGGRRWTICFLLMMQLFLIIAMYRISTTRARELFLTTYYDPFYPDLHLYITKPDTLQLSMHGVSKASWFTIPYTFYLEGLKASTLQIWHNISIMVWNWQQLLWDKLGEGSPQIATWPPT